MSHDDPYRPPRYDVEIAKSSGPPVARPTVVTWYRVYSSAMMLLYGVLAAGAVVLLVVLPQLEMPEDDRIGLYIQGIVFAVMCTPLAIVFLIGALVPTRRWGWIYGIVMIGIGLTSLCTLPATLPLLIYWLKPETKAYFRV